MESASTVPIDPFGKHKRSEGGKRRMESKKVETYTYFCTNCRGSYTTRVKLTHCMLCGSRLLSEMKPELEHEKID